MAIRDKHQMLQEKATSPRSVDFGRPYIYQFERYCRRCRAGLMKPPGHARREIKLLYRRSYCASRCWDQGPTTASPTVRIAGKEGHFNKYNIIEQAALAGLMIKRQVRKLTQLQIWALEAETRCRVRSAKLRFMEVKTGGRWYPKKFYRVLSSVQHLL